MALISIQEAAQRIGATEALIHRWIRQGFLKGYVRSETELSATTGILLSDGGTLALLAETNLMVDSEELDDVAETEGWLLLAAGSFEED